MSNPKKFDNTIMPEKTVMSEANISLPKDFVFGEVLVQPKKIGAPPSPQAPLGPLVAFVGSWTGRGFNTIFRPNNPTTPTTLDDGSATIGDNVLQLNLTSENLTFSKSLGSVPNRGMVQGDINLNGVSYLQVVNDITRTGLPGTGIHVEPGLWMCVPSTNNPAEVQTIVRMGSIPHGTTINAQGTSTTFNGPPNIPPVNITPFPTLGGPPIRFPSQTAINNGTPRIPQALTDANNNPIIFPGGAITQAMLDDPNTFLRNHITGQNIISTTQISVSTFPPSPTSPPLINPIPNMPQVGGGTDNIAFLNGNPPPNAQSIKMAATFWIETIQHTILVPIFKPGQPPLMIKGEAKIPGQIVPIFHVNPPIGITVPRTITFTSMQIQYSQVVFLNFNGLTWPHVSVATLVPAGSIPIPPSAWA